MKKYIVLYLLTLCLLPQHALAVYPSGGIFAGIPSFSLFGRKGNQPPKRPRDEALTEDRTPKQISEELENLLRQMQVAGITLDVAEGLFAQMQKLYAQYLTSPAVQRYPNNPGPVQARDFLEQARLIVDTLRSAPLPQDDEGFADADFGTPYVHATDAHSPQAAILPAQVHTIQRAVQDGVLEVLARLGFAQAVPQPVIVEHEGPLLGLLNSEVRESEDAPLLGLLDDEPRASSSSPKSKKKTRRRY